MKTGTLIAWILLIIVAIAHLIRAILKLEMIIDDYSIPMSVSWVAFIVLILLTSTMWSEHRKG